MLKSKQPRKQRRERMSAPLHQRQKFLRAPLDEEERKKYSKRNARVIKGDVVRVVRGDHAGTEGKVQNVDLKRGIVTIDGVTLKKADGSEIAKPIYPSKVVITKLNLKDELRKDLLKR
ncbi:MAG: 50S ribosomal protein L24 [Methanocellales archaeon]|nr:50S ribosomal protein L24 [Methanocellales archaeon]MDD3291133.1 50S ribosomal protein L24 [Methanocellales archaeon]MDD5235233.1 50S ribosomal protein L24 [Methanocellales archaeon]MDD5484611.1 50S ribosomal protein L24 [Methanocellales archaeon]